MNQYIDKDALIAEINKRIVDAIINDTEHQRISAYNDVKDIINSLEVKNVDDSIGVKQGEQKPADKVEPKFHKGDIIRHKKQGFTCKIIAVDTEYRLSECNGTHLPFDSQDAYELVEQNPTWSEEDDEMLNLIIARLHSHPNVDLEEYSKEYHWLNYSLKSLKEKVLPQPKQEWSEEDEQYVKDALALLVFGASVHTISQVQDWLKHLKERYTWKPSEEQMEALKGVQEGVFRLGILASLYQDLKKLREE